MIRITFISSSLLRASCADQHMMCRGISALLLPQGNDVLHLGKTASNPEFCHRELACLGHQRIEFLGFDADGLEAVSGAWDVSIFSSRRCGSILRARLFLDMHLRGFGSRRVD